jgi:hypothetical protein
MEELIRADRRITIDSVATALGCSHGLAYSIMHDRLKLRKVCTQWVPREVKGREKWSEWVCPCNIFHCKQMKEKTCLTGLLLGTNHECITTNIICKSASLQWKHSTSLSTKKFKVTASDGKVMLTVFRDSQGVLLAHFQKRVENVTSASYCDVLLKLQNAISRKPPGQLARGILFHHDNTRPHTVRSTQERIQELHWELLDQQP